MALDRRRQFERLGFTFRWLMRDGDDDDLRCLTTVVAHDHDGAGPVFRTLLTPLPYSRSHR